MTSVSCRTANGAGGGRGSEDELAADHGLLLVLMPRGTRRDRDRCGGQLPRRRPAATQVMTMAMTPSSTRQATGRAKTGARARAARPRAENHSALPRMAPAANPQRAGPWEEPTDPS